MVNESGSWNKDTCCVKVNKSWNFTLLSQLLIDYHDKEILQYLMFGWPVDHDEDTPLELRGCNHRGATEFEEVIDKYIEKEIRLGATIDPFENIPFKCPVAISPLSTRPKKDSTDRHIIMDCSWPIGSSLNDGIDKDMYMGNRIKLSYPTVDKLAKRIYLLSIEGVEPVFMYKEDMDRAFRQIWADPKSVPLLGFKW